MTFVKSTAAIVSAKLAPAMSATVNFLKVPANLLSMAAIIATVIVPIVDKFVKSDEEKRTKLSQIRLEAAPSLALFTRLDEDHFANFSAFPHEVPRRP